MKMLNSFQVMATCAVLSSPTGLCAEPSGLPVHMGQQAMSYMNAGDHGTYNVYVLEQDAYDPGKASRIRRLAAMDNGELEQAATGTMLLRQGHERQFGFDPKTTNYYFDDTRLVPPSGVIDEQEAQRRALVALGQVVEDVRDWVLVRMDTETLMVAGSSQPPYLAKRTFAYAPLLDGRLVLSSSVGVDISLGSAGSILGIDARLPKFVRMRTLSRSIGRASLERRVAFSLDGRGFKKSGSVFEPQSILVRKATDSYWGRRDGGRELLIPHISAFCELTDRLGREILTTVHLTQDAMADKRGVLADDIIGE